jgi:hypothetical protein
MEAERLLDAFDLGSGLVRTQHERHRHVVNRRQRAGGIGEGMRVRIAQHAIDIGENDDWKFGCHGCGAFHASRPRRRLPSGRNGILLPETMEPAELVSIGLT